MGAILSLALSFDFYNKCKDKEGIISLDQYTYVLICTDSEEINETDIKKK
tara:strand:- start:822 stop:971 length:150 start_codon:yes stop_codon:yes gene_type:complete